MPDREKVISDLEYLISEDCTDTQFDYIESIQDALTLLKEQENASKRNPVIVCPHCGKRIK